MVVDFSAHSAWDECPALWYERYVNRRRKRWPSTLRNDALCLGSLYHNGMENWHGKGQFQIDQAVIEEVTPDQDTLLLAQRLVYGYIQQYPQEPWPLVVCEEPVQMPLISNGACWACPWCGVYGQGECNLRPTQSLCLKCGKQATQMYGQEELTLLAKIDTYFYCPEPTMVDSGVPGIFYTLNPGWWIHEHKTKSPSIPIGMYMQGWEMGMQASYQTLALNHLLKDRMGLGESVQGVLVNVAEKPRVYTPKRTCKECKSEYEFYRWLPTGTGLYACPVCGNRQKLTPLKEATPTVPPNYYRIMVTRSEEQLALDQQHIVEVGQRMISMAQNGILSEPWRKGNCVNTKWNRACDYFSNHQNGVDTRSDETFETPPDYRGLVTLEPAA